MGELDTDTIGRFVTLIALAALSVAAKWQRRAGRSMATNDRQDMRVEIKQPEKQSIQPFIARQDVSADDLVSARPAAWGLFVA